MNKIVEDQLKKVKICKLPEYDENTLELHIPKQSSNIQCSVEENHCYILQLERYIIDPPPNFTLHSNWNKGIPPKHEIVKAEVGVRIDSAKDFGKNLSNYIGASLEVIGNSSKAMLQKGVGNILKGMQEFASGAEDSLQKVEEAKKRQQEVMGKDNPIGEI